MFFNEEQHVYTHKVTGEIYPSVTTVLGKYKNKFESVKISEGFVRKHPELNEDGELRKYLDKLLLLNVHVDEIPRPITAEIIRDLWERSSVAAQIKGNHFHFKHEMEMLYNQTLLDDEYNDRVYHLWNDIDGGYYPELRLWSEKYKIAGTADKIYIKKPYVWIRDYKTNKRLISKGNKKYCMKYPLQYLPDSSYYHYEMQLNIYAAILEEWGYIVKDMTIEHKRFLDTDVIPDNYRYMWETDEQVKKLITLPVNHYPIRTKNFLQYDYEQRQAT